MGKRNNDEKADIYALYFFISIFALIPICFVFLLLYRFFIVTSICLTLLLILHLVIVVRKRKILKTIISSCQNLNINISANCYKSFIKSYTGLEYQLAKKSVLGTHISSIKFKESSFWAEHNQYWLFFYQLKSVNICLGKRCNILIKLYIDNFSSTLEEQELSCSFKYRNNAKELYRIFKTIIEIEKSYGKDLPTETKWQSEFLLKEICENLFGKDNVLFHYRPKFLKTEKGQLSYDVFVKNKNIAFEYQGKQHYEPIDYFGGEEKFKYVQKRDALKKLLSEENCVRLIYINYNEELNIDLIKNKVKDIESFNG